MAKQTGKKIIIGNWKMNPASPKAAEKLFAEVAKSASGIKKTEIVICPPFIYLERLKKLSKKINLGAQNVFGREVGPFTGEVSADMIYNIGARYVILGHSERRTLGESDSDVNKKIKAALSAGLLPILCVGEETRDEDHQYFNVVKEQIRACLYGVPKNLISKIIVAYEPVWAISTTLGRKDATSTDCREMAVFIRKVLSDIASLDIAKDVHIIYGGSVNERDAEEFLKDGGAEGLLVGRASLDAKKFSEIVKICEALNS